MMDVIELPCTAKHGRFFDVHIICNESCFGAHKFILAMQSKYLKDSFLTIARETQNTQDTCKIVMDDVEGIDLENLLNYIYDGEIGVTKSHVGGFLRAGKFLQLDTITDLMAENEEFNLQSDKYKRKFEATLSRNRNVGQRRLSPIQEVGIPESSLSPIRKRTFESADENDCDDPYLPMTRKSPLSSTMISGVEVLSRKYGRGESLEEGTSESGAGSGEWLLDAETVAFSVGSLVDSHYYKSAGLSV